MQEVLARLDQLAKDRRKQFYPASSSGKAYARKMRLMDREPLERGK
jgi:cell division inhibitor SulA